MNSLSHVAIIMDGNGRWARKNRKTRNFGHLEGTKNIQPIIKYCLKNNIPYLTLFAFSYENWKRPKKEIQYIFHILKKFINENLANLISNNVKVNFIGEKKKIDKITSKLISKVEKSTLKNDKLNIFIAFNYSSKLEIVNSVNKFLKLKKNKKKLNFRDIENNLYTQNSPHPEILIRTGGYNRLSDFLLWQCSFSEIFFIKKNWPDFKVADLISIIKKYKKIKRNFGSI